MSPHHRLIAAAIAMLHGDPRWRRSPQQGSDREPIADQVEPAIAGGTQRFTTAPSTLLAGGVDEYGQVNYRFFQTRRADLDRTWRPRGRNLSKLAPAELETLLINAYNAITVPRSWPAPASPPSATSTAYGTKPSTGSAASRSPSTTSSTRCCAVLRDPRIHFAVNCASASCAPLPRWAFDGAQLDRQLDERARLFLSDARTRSSRAGSSSLSRYFDWYGDDFTAEGWKPRADYDSGVRRALFHPEVAARIRAAGPLDSSSSTTTGRSTRRRRRVRHRGGAPHSGPPWLRSSRSSARRPSSGPPTP